MKGVGVAALVLVAAIGFAAPSAMADYHGGGHGGGHGSYGGHGGVSVGVNLSFGRSYYHPYPHYYRSYFVGPPVVVYAPPPPPVYYPAPVYVPSPQVIYTAPPPPVIVQQPAAVVVQPQQPVVVQAPAPPPATQVVPEPQPQPEAQAPQPVLVDPPVAAYLGTLRNGDDGQRKTAAKELRDYNIPVVVSALIDSLMQDGSANVREKAAESLGHMVARDAQPALRAAARQDPKDDVRKAALKAAKKIEEAYAIQP